ncbi:MAG: NAD(P)H-dependent oxidoreductase subunit E [Victivallales bacterium]
MGNTVNNVIKKYNGDETRLMDILMDIQSELGYLSDWTIEQISKALDIPKVSVEQTVSFYHFFTKEPRGKYTVYLNTSVLAVFFGRDEVARAFEEAAGCKFGSVTKDGLIGLFDTACIGMSDQEPAAIINEEVFTCLSTAKAKAIIAGMRAGKAVSELNGGKYGDGQNSSPLIRSMVNNNIMKRGEVVFADYMPGSGIRKAVGMSSNEIIQLVKSSYVRGRGGAGFPTGMKWEVAKKAHGDVKYIFCNADEGEPGTFKDRVILTEFPCLVFEGMAVAGYAVGAKYGILYLRNEYRYLRKYLEDILEKMRDDNLLGTFIGGKQGFNFDIKIQFGAGAYVCGEESALIESAEGKRGEPRDRPPFPVEKGYLQKPTVVNNVETLCSVVRILINGSEWYNKLGTKESKGTKVISVSGDCRKPGIYEIEWGFTVNDILKMVEASDTQAVQVGGPSGSCIAPNEFPRELSYEDLATGGSLIIIGKKRDLLEDVVLNFTEFFRDESCGSCVPCRALSGMSKVILERIIEGRGTEKDVASFGKWQSIMKKNRCGLGQTALNPIVTTIKNFPEIYKNKIKVKDDRFCPAFDLGKAVADYDAATAEAR